MNRFKKIGGLVFLLTIIPWTGCDRPETPSAGYGKIVSELPNLPDRPQTLPLPEDVRLGRNGIELIQNAEKTADSLPE